jgi:thymidylate kinase
MKKPITPRKSSKPLKYTRKVKSKTNGYVFSICGVHGVGKTTVYNLLNRIFEEHSNINFFPERLSTTPPFPFGSKDHQIAFRSEIHYNQQMIQRNGLVKDLVKNKRDSIVVLDRSPISTIVYSRALNLPAKDYQLIEDTFHSQDWVEENVIYLEAEPNTIMNRILRRGSLDQERTKWNEDDFDYLKRIIHLYDEVFNEFRLKEKSRLERIWTDNLSPEQIAEAIIKIIERKSGISIKRAIHLPANQAKLTQWFE